jgi:gliding motility-associated-like protein
MKKIFTLICLAISQLAFSQTPPTAGLVAHYPLNGNANDVGGNNFNGVNLNGPFVPTTDRFGVAGGAIYLDGVDDYIRIQDNGSFSTPQLSISVWFLSESSNLQCLIGKRNYTTSAGSGGSQYQMFLNYPPFPGVGSNLVGNNSDCSNAFASSYINTQDQLCINGWNHFVATFDGARHKLYLNGVLKRDEPTTFNAFLACSSELRIGTWWQQDPQSFKGKVDDLRWYNRALTVSEIQILSQGAVSCQPIANCSNWLGTTTGGYATVGDLDVTGNQLTIEANFNRTQPLNSGSFYGHLVSKHTDQTNVNYSLLPNGCEITTTVSGYTSTFQTCPPVLNKTYHVAMVYDGSTLKFYRNGFLLSSQPCTGNLVNNDLATTIAQISSSGAPANNQFLGFTNEVRIWNVARSQAQIRQFMNGSLPSPATQTGLLGYYNFSNLVNNQGNTSFNGTLASGAAINRINPNCNFSPDSCGLIINPPPPPPPLNSTIINQYSPILDFNPCNNFLTLADATNFKVGDTVLMIQMKGASIDSTNTAAFGNIINYKNAGNYEFNFIKSKSGNSVELKNRLLKNYDINDGKVQLVTVPYFNNYTVTVDTLTCLPWDGNKGGVLVFNVQNTLTLNGPIDVSGKGFRGGLGTNANQLSQACETNVFAHPNGTTIAVQKGESITNVLANKQSGRAPLAAGGGGGVDHNSGGGGGANYGVGGIGGYQYQNCPAGSSFDNRGMAGKALQYSNAANKIFMGSGGGGGHCNNGNATPSGVSSSFDGGNGGGIIIISANNIVGNANNINANGNNGYEIPVRAEYTHEGMGGGGAGGAIVLKVTGGYTSNTNASVKGGRGGNMWGDTGGGKCGPGGGGGAGVVWLNQSTIPASLTNNIQGGINGVVIDDNSNYGAAAGQNGQTLFNLSLPNTTIPFIKNIDSVKIVETQSACLGYNFNAIGFTNTSAIQTWQWQFGDGTTGTGQATTHTYNSADSFFVKLIGIDANGCKDSTIKKIMAGRAIITISPADTICHNSNTTLVATGGSSYSWSPSTGLSNPNIANPIAAPSNNTTYTVTVTNAIGCTAVDSVKVSVIQRPQFGISSNKDISCLNASVNLQATGGNQYVWTPAQSLNNSTIANPIASPTTTTTYSVIITSTQCNDVETLTKLITVAPAPNVNAVKSNDISCNQTIAKITSNGANSYSWYNANFSSFLGAGNSISVNPTVTTEYWVVGTDVNSCTDSAKIKINVSKLDKLVVQFPNIFTPNSDGLNDCLGFTVLNGFEVIEFSVFDRWGVQVFASKNSNVCWDGTYKGKAQPEGNYVYQLRLKNLCGTTFKSGNVILAR